MQDPITQKQLEDMIPDHPSLKNVLAQRYQLLKGKVPHPNRKDKGGWLSASTRITEKAQEQYNEMNVSQHFKKKKTLKPRLKWKQKLLKCF
jgi:hypothetical protein